MSVRSSALAQGKNLFIGEGNLPEHVRSCMGSFDNALLEPGMNRTFGDSYRFHHTGDCVGAVGPAKTIRFQPFFFCALDAPRRAQITDVWGGPVLVDTSVA